MASDINIKDLKRSKPEEAVVTPLSSTDYIHILKTAQEQLRPGNRKLTATSLSMCLRKTVFSVINPLPIENNSYDYIACQVAHDIIVRLFSVFPHRFQIEKEIHFENVSGRIDVYDKLNDCIIEVKVSASQKPILKPFKFHEEQIRDYMAIQDSQDGVIFYHMNNMYGKYRLFLIHMSIDERKIQLEKLRLHSKSVLNAIEANDASLVNGVYDDPDMEWLCSKCPYLEDCTKLRPPSKETGKSPVWIKYTDPKDLLRADLGTRRFTNEVGV